MLKFSMIDHKNLLYKLIMFNAMITTVEISCCEIDGQFDDKKVWKFNATTENIWN